MFAANRNFDILRYADHLHRQQKNKRTTANCRQRLGGSSSQFPLRNDKDRGTLANETHIASHQTTCLHARSKHTPAGLLTTETETPASTSSPNASYSRSRSIDHHVSSSDPELIGRGRYQPVTFCLYCHEELSAKRIECKTCVFRPHLCEQCRSKHPADHDLVSTGGSIKAVLDRNVEEFRSENSQADANETIQRGGGARSEDVGEATRVERADRYQKIDERVGRDNSDEEAGNEHEDDHGFSTSESRDEPATLNEDGDDSGQRTDSTFDDELTDNERDALMNAVQRLSNERDRRRQKSIAIKHSQLNTDANSMASDYDTEDSSIESSVEDGDSDDELDTGHTDDILDGEDGAHEQDAYGINNTDPDGQREPTNQGYHAIPTHVTVTFPVDAFMTLRSLINNVASGIGLVDSNMDDLTGLMNGDEPNELLNFNYDDLGSRASQGLPTPSDRPLLKHFSSKSVSEKRLWHPAEKRRLRRYKDRGWTVSRIGTALKRTPGAIRQQWRKQESEKRSGLNGTA